MIVADFYKRRAGILRHLKEGAISLFDAGVHDLLCQIANSRIDDREVPPGVWIGSASAIHALAPRESSHRRIRRALEHLAEIGWIKRFPGRGRRGNYPILVNRLEVRGSAGAAYLVDAGATTDWKHPVLAALRRSLPPAAVPQLPSPARAPAERTLAADRAGCLWTELVRFAYGSEADRPNLESWELAVFESLGGRAAILKKQQVNLPLLRRDWLDAYRAKAEERKSWEQELLPVTAVEK